MLHLPGMNKNPSCFSSVMHFWHHPVVFMALWVYEMVSTNEGAWKTIWQNENLNLLSKVFIIRQLNVIIPKRELSLCCKLRYRDYSLYIYTLPVYFKEFSDASYNRGVTRELLQVAWVTATYYISGTERNEIWQRNKQTMVHFVWCGPLKVILGNSESLSRSCVRWCRQWKKKSPCRIRHHWGVQLSLYGVLTCSSLGDSYFLNKFPTSVFKQTSWLIQHKVNCERVKKDIRYLSMYPFIFYTHQLKSFTVIHRSRGL